MYLAKHFSDNHIIPGARSLAMVRPPRVAYPRIAFLDPAFDPIMEVVFFCVPD